MAGTFVSDTIQNGAGATVSTTAVINGSAKAWVNFQGGLSGTAGTIYGSYNVSSVTVVTTGTYLVNFTAPMPNVNYAFSGGGEYYPAASALMCVSAFGRTASYIAVNVNYVNSTVFNTDRVNVVVFSS
jgi:hypothetical protein